MRAIPAHETGPRPVTVREIDPFSFFINHASAIEGLGGTEASPDPRYCFHTPYLDVRPGRAVFHVMMNRVQATRGELSLRVHGFRDGADAMMIASSKLLLEGMSDVNIDHAIHFSALEGVQYALLAFFTEPSDVMLASLAIRLEELDDRIAVRANMGGGTPSRIPAGTQLPSPRLLADTPPAFGNPVSQPCSRAQLEDPRFARGWPAVTATGETALRRWELAVGLQALKRAGMLAAGAQGLLLDPPHPVLMQELAGAGVAASDMVLAPLPDPAAALHRWIDKQGAEGAFDFVLSHTTLACGGGGHLEQIGAGLRAMRGGGIGVFLLPYWSGPATQERPAAAAACLDRNDIQRAVLRLIGQSYAVAQLALPRSAAAGGEVTSFVLTVHRPAEG